MEKKHGFDCIDCEQEMRSIRELKIQAIGHFRKSEKCKQCGKENPSFLKIYYKTIPFADKIDQDYMIFHTLVISSKVGWEKTDNISPYCYDCYEKEREYLKSLPDKGEYIEFVGDF